MNRRELLTAATASVALAAWGSMPGMKGMDPILGALSSQLGVSDTQAGGGLGSILSLAKSKLSTQDFSCQQGSTRWGELHQGGAASARFERVDHRQGGAEVSLRQARHNARHDRQVQAGSARDRGQARWRFGRRTAHAVDGQHVLRAGRAGDHEIPSAPLPLPAKVTVAARPDPVGLSPSITCAPCRSAIRLTMARPRPLPSVPVPVPGAR